MVGRLGDDLDPVVEFHTENEFWQMIVSVEPSPTFLCALEQLEDHGERGPVGQTALRSDGAVAHGGEGAFNGIGSPQELAWRRLPWRCRASTASRDDKPIAISNWRERRGRSSGSCEQARAYNKRGRQAGGVSIPGRKGPTWLSGNKYGVASNLSSHFDRLRAAKLGQAYDILIPDLVPNRRRREDGGARR
jgi:hypothetical protein